MTTRLAPDRLWPVLSVLVALLAAAVVLQQMAARRTEQGRVIEIGRGATPAAVSDDESGDDDGSGLGAPAETVPVDADHAAARLAARRGQLDDAIALYQKCAAAHPDADRVLAELGYWLLAAGKEKDAQHALERAQLLAPRDPWVVLNLGVSRRRQGDLAGAEREYRRALELRADFGAAQIALGSLLSKRKKLDEAIAVLEAAARAGANDQRARALVALGRAYLLAGRRADGGRAFDRAIEYAPAAVEIRVEIGRAWLLTGKEDDLARAAAAVTRAAELAPDVPQVFSALARVREKRGDKSAAEADYEHALRLDPDYTYARRRLLRLALERQDYPRARLMAEYLLKSAPNEPEHHFLAGLVAARDGRRDDARGHYRDAIDKAHGDYPEAWLNLGNLEKGGGDLDAAIAAYRKAIELRPEYQQAFNNLGLALGAAGNTADAEETFRKALAIDPQYATGWLNLGELYAGAGRDADAISAFERAIAARPGYPEARLDLAVSYQHGGRVEQALDTYRALVADHPRYVAAWHNLGLALEAAGHDTDAEDAWRHALAINADHVPSLRKLADLEARTGRAADAKATYEEVSRVLAESSAR